MQFHTRVLKFYKQNFPWLTREWGEFFCFIPLKSLQCAMYEGGGVYFHQHTFKSQTTLSDLRANLDFSLLETFALVIFGWEWKLFRIQIHSQMDGAKKGEEKEEKCENVLILSKNESFNSNFNYK